MIEKFLKATQHLCSKVYCFMQCIKLKSALVMKSGSYCLILIIINIKIRENSIHFTNIVFVKVKCYTSIRKSDTKVIIVKYSFLNLF